MASEFKNTNPAKRWVLALVVLALIITAVVVLRGAGRWLIREDPLARTDVIVVLSGSMPYRAEEAAQVFKMGYAPEVWVSHPEGPSADMKQLGVHFTGEEEYNRDVLISQGVPETAVRILPHEIIDTEQEVEEVSREMRRTGKHSVIFVTSMQHTRRVKALWHKLVGDNPAALVHGAPEDPFDCDHWWNNTRDSLAVVREVLGLMNVWAGLPVRPHAKPQT
jgi:uncharacterized SAM-binding protein YcdF (DUF218 family)